MDIKMVSGLISAILFIVFASSQAFSIVRDLGIKDKDTSMIVRSALSGIFTYLALSMLL